MTPLGVVRSEIAATKGADPTATRYRNTHVFTKQKDEDWRCVAWQVTELASGDQLVAAAPSGSSGAASPAAPAPPVNPPAAAV